jgi:hypothetical protein
LDGHRLPDHRQPRRPNPPSGILQPAVCLILRYYPGQTAMHHVILNAVKDLFRMVPVHWICLCEEADDRRSNLGQGGLMKGGVTPSLNTSFDYLSPLKLP